MSWGGNFPNSFSLKDPVCPVFLRPWDWFQLVSFSTLSLKVIWTLKHFTAHININRSGFAFRATSWSWKRLVTDSEWMKLFFGHNIYKKESSRAKSDVLADVAIITSLLPYLMIPHITFNYWFLIYYPGGAFCLQNFIRNNIRTIVNKSEQ